MKDSGDAWNCAAMIKLSPTFEEAFARWRGEPTRAVGPTKAPEPESVDDRFDPFSEWSDEEPTLVDRKPPPRT